MFVMVVVRMQYNFEASDGFKREFVMAKDTKIKIIKGSRGNFPKRTLPEGGN